jgi:hypothetical protein
MARQMKIDTILSKLHRQLLPILRVSPRIPCQEHCWWPILPGVCCLKHVSNDRPLADIYLTEKLLVSVQAVLS